MRYNQPFGTPEPALGVYPRFVNGNPTTGTEGSIPPARAFDEDQIEIVTVIQNVGLTPNHTELDQLWQALQLLIAKKYITTPITKTVHGVGADFPDMISALRWLSEYTITNTGYVTFSLAPGKWTYTQSIEINHPNSNRINIQGAALMGGTPQPANLSVTGYHSSADGTNQIIYLRTVHATELQFTGGVNAFLVVTGGAILRYLLLTGSQTIASGLGQDIHGNSYQGNGIYLQSNDISLDGVSIWGFGQHGLWIPTGSTARMITSLSLVCAFNGSIGIAVSGGSFEGSTGSEVICCSNNVVGANLIGGFFWANNLTIKGHGPPNGNAAIQVEQGGLFACNHVYVSINQAGCIFAGAGTYLGEFSAYFNNASYGLYVTGTATAWVNYSSFSGNGSFDIIANCGAFVDGTGSSWASTTPPMNTLGNIEAFIMH
jgi:hypothetical protein